jgi:hypothetical protein
MILIESKTVGTAVSGVEFTSIPQTFTDVVLQVSGRSSTGSTRADIFLTINGDTGSNYSIRRLIGFDSGSVQSYAESGTPTQTNLISITGNGATADTFGNLGFYFPNYTSTTTKSFSVDNTAENNSTSAYIMGIFAGRYTTSSAITSIKIEPQSSNFMTGSILSLYGVLKGSDGIVTTSP